MKRSFILTPKEVTQAVLNLLVEEGDLEENRGYAVSIRTRSVSGGSLEFEFTFDEAKD
jgi:hypothetical protein